MPSNDDDFFSAAFENGPLKTCSLIFSIFSGLILLPSMYGIVWYEHYGNDLKRILLNMLVSAMSWVGIVWYVLLQPIEMLRYTYGPLPEALCYFQVIMKNSLHLQSVMTSDALTIVRCLFLFVLKNTDRFKDDFWNRFINIWISAFCFIPQFVFFCLPGRQPLILYICLGKVPSNRTSEWTAEGPKKNYILTYVIVLSIVLQFLAGLQIIRHKLKSMKNASEEDRLIFRRQLKSIAAGSFIFIAVASVVRWLSLKINQFEPDMVNVYPNYVFVFAQSFATPFLGCASFAIFFYARNVDCGLTIWTEIEEYLKKNNWMKMGETSLVVRTRVTSLVRCLPE